MPPAVANRMHNTGSQPDSDLVGYSVYYCSISGSSLASDGAGKIHVVDSIQPALEGDPAVLYAMATALGWTGLSVNGTWYLVVGWQRKPAKPTDIKVYTCLDTNPRAHFRYTHALRTPQKFARNLFQYLGNQWLVGGLVHQPTA